MPIHFGLALPNQHPRAMDQRACFEEQLQLVRRARDLGWDSVFTGQHFLMPENSMMQPVPYLARLAAETGEMALGIGISLLALLNPVQVAEDLASLDVICGGRLIAGFGLGYREEEYAAFGLSRGQGVARLEGNLGALRHLWAGKAGVDLPWCRVPDGELSILPLQRPHPPIWLAAHVDAAIRRAARLADAWYVSPHVTVETVQRQLALYRAERAAHGLGADVLPVAKEMYCAATTAQALAVGGPYVTGKYRTYAAWGQDAVLPEDVSFQADLETLRQDRFVIGSPRECTDRLLQTIRTLSPSHVVLRAHWPGMPLDVTLSSLERFSHEVLPALREAGRP